MLGPSPTAGARSPNPTPSLETGRGRAPRQEVWQQPWGKEPGPASVTRILLDRAPALSGFCASEEEPGNATTAESRVRRTRPAAEASSHSVPPAQQWFSPWRRQTISEPGRPGTIPLARQRGSHPRAAWSLWQQARVRALVGRRGEPRESRPDAHIRAKEGVGPEMSRGPEPEAGSPGICQVPGRARASGRLVPTSPGRRPRGPHGRLARPHPVALGRRPARPGPTQPGRSPPVRGPGSDFAPGPTGAERAGQCLQAPPAPGRVGKAASSLGRGTFLSARRCGAPPHKHP